VWNTLPVRLLMTPTLDHCSYLRSLLIARTFYRLTNKLSQNYLQMMYFAVDYPRILYGVEMYANTGITHILVALSPTNTLTCRLPHFAALCDHNPPTLQTDRQTGGRTDGQTSCS